MSNSPSVWREGIVAGFGSALAMWSAWFVTHLPWLNISERVALPVVVGVWGLVLLLMVRGLARTVPSGLFAGVLSAGLGLLILGSKLAKPPDAGGVSEGVVPNAGLIAAGFLVLGGVLGVIAGFAARLAGGSGERTSPRDERATVHALALVASLALAPLLFIGGLVTSTNSGMAVPDWPNTFGSNMFLYPLGPRANPSVYLEHSHRLFGTLAGVCVIALAAVSLGFRSTRRSAGVRAAVLLVLVIAQGVLGGTRVTLDNTWLATLHGFLAQVVLALAVTIAVTTSRAYAEGGLLAVGKRLKGLAVGAQHAVFVQLIFGAMYRHTRSAHALYTHLAFAFLVLGIALAAGFFTRRVEEPHPVARGVRRAGVCVVVLMGLQFVLGWGAFLAGGRGKDPVGTVDMLLRTVHQANGAAVLAAIVCLAELAKRGKRSGGVAERAGGKVAE